MSGLKAENKPFLVYGGTHLQQTLPRKQKHINVKMNTMYHLGLLIASTRKTYYYKCHNQKRKEVNLLAYVIGKIRSI